MSNLSEEESKAMIALRVYGKSLTDEEFQNMTTVIKDLVERLVKENKHLRELNGHQSKEITKAVNYTFELNKEIEIKDNMIDLMCEHIVSSAVADDTVCGVKFCEVKTDCTHEKMLKCTKEYFRKKVEDNG